MTHELALISLNQADVYINQIDEVLSVCRVRKELKDYLSEIFESLRVEQQQSKKYLKQIQAENQRLINVPKPLIEVNISTLESEEYYINTIVESMMNNFKQAVYE